MTWEECLESRSRTSVPIPPLELMWDSGNPKTEVLLQKTQSMVEGSGSADIAGKSDVLGSPQPKT